MTADQQDECEACEAERKGLPFDIRSACTGAYCDPHADDHVLRVVDSLGWFKGRDPRDDDFWLHLLHCPETGRQPAQWTGQYGDPDRKLVLA